MVSNCSSPNNGSSGSKAESTFDIALFRATDPKTSVRYAPSRRQCPELTSATPDATFFEFVRL